MVLRMDFRRSASLRFRYYQCDVDGNRRNAGHREGQVRLVKRLKAISNPHFTRLRRASYVFEIAFKFRLLLFQRLQKLNGYIFRAFEKGDHIVGGFGGGHEK